MNIFKKRKSNKKGFTLMEMLIVVAIIGILIAIAIPTFSNALTKARISADEANIRSFYSEVITDYMLNGKVDSKLHDFVKGTNLATIKNGTNNGVTKIQISGADYTLQAGSCSITVDDDNGNLSILYTPTNKSFPTVTIPNGKSEAQQTTGSST